MSSDRRISPGEVLYCCLSVLLGPPVSIRVGANGGDSSWGSRKDIGR